MLRDTRHGVISSKYHEITPQEAALFCATASAGDVAPSLDALRAVPAAVALAGTAPSASTLATTAAQLQRHDYAGPSNSGDNVTAAWRYSTGTGITAAVIDDGFDSIITGQFTDFDTARSLNLSGTWTFEEPSGSLHGTTTAAEIGDPGNSGQAIGVAPGARVIGIKVAFGSLPIGMLAYGLNYAASVADVVNNSWSYGSFGDGQTWSPGCAAWYQALQTAVQADRDGLGTVIVFAAGNNRAQNDNLALHAITADPRVIAVAAVDGQGAVASFSTPGAALLVAAAGTNITAPGYGGSYTTASSNGTSFAAPVISGIATLMLSANPTLGWRDVQEILADSAYAPAAASSGFVSNGAADWNGGGRHFSNDLGFGVVDANVAVNLARVWTGQATSRNLATTVSSYGLLQRLSPNAGLRSYLSFLDDTRIQHVQVVLHDSNLLAAGTRLVLVSPDGTRSALTNQPGLVGGYDNTHGLDLNNLLLTSNAFWGENAAGVWTLEVQNLAGTTLGYLQDWQLTIWGDDATALAPPLVYTPEFAALAAAAASRTLVSPGAANATTIDLIALPGTSSLNLQGGRGLIDGVPVTVQPGLRTANAAGCTGEVTLIGPAGGGTLTGGDGLTHLQGSGGDVIQGGLGATTIDSGAGGDSITLSSAAAPQTPCSITSGGGDTIWAGTGTVSIVCRGSIGDTVEAQGATLNFINGSGASVVHAGSGTVSIQGGSGGGVFYAGAGGHSVLTGGTGQVELHGMAAGDILTAGGRANDVLIGGDGGETLNGGSATGDITLVSGAGDDTMTAGLGRTTFILGRGNDALRLGGVADTITVTNGTVGGSSVIRGFRPGIDTLHLLDFPPPTAAAAVLAAQPDGSGGVMLRLPDGTSLDFIGLAHLPTSAFV